MRLTCRRQGLPCDLHVEKSMNVQSLSVTCFRNLGRLQLSPAPGVNVLHGLNGSGKTNLLEALFTLCLGRSQRRAPDTVLLQHECDVYRLEGKIATSSGPKSPAVAFQRGGRKKVTIDGAPSKLRELYDHFCAVSVGPEDSEILAGPPAVRRAFLDMYLSQFSRLYLSDLIAYQAALAQKNAALKRDMDPSPFDGVLISHGARVTCARNSFLSSLAAAAAEYYARISGGERFELRYRPSVPLSNGHAEIGDAEVAFQVQLDGHSDRERAVQTALVGPHRDEILFSVAGYPARMYGSQGQWRTAAVALKLALYQMLKRERGMPPLLLLDEIFAELDEARAMSLIGLFEGFSQLFLTTAHKPPAHLRESGAVFRLEDGRIEEQP
ncbi:MAG TPA: DNA replication/repair protein RecF [Acidobacteriota bacterium]|nr:DNA replication/repair protein RecF [Acidobacteriota bacterium]